MDRVITLLMALCVSAGLMFAWDRHPPIGVHVPVLIWRVGFDLPDSLATQRDHAVAGRTEALRVLGASQGNVERLQASLTAQNRAVAALSADSDRRQAAGLLAVQGARSVAASWRQRAADILAAKPADADLCKAADKLILEAVQ